MPLIQLNRLARAFGDVKALTDVTLTLEPGTIGLVGNNGAGKSTLLKILLGLLEPSEGSGTILDCDLREATRRIRTRIGYMPENDAIVPTLKGAEFVALAGDLYGMPHRDARRRAHEVLNYVGLGELRYRKLEEYSTGNRQRLKLAAALVHDPDLLLLDEPTNGLDPPGRIGMLRLIDDLIAETGKSVILCTHLLSDVERLCRQVVVLEAGSVVFCGEMADLHHSRPSRYYLRWEGDANAFLIDLATAGMAIDREDGDAAWITVADDFRARQLFRLAGDHALVIVQLRPEEESLQDMFFRLTDRP